ncbi:hypothetical protein WA158_000530 [Blastocystis sp. Blastoise]
MDIDDKEKAQYEKDREEVEALSKRLLEKDKESTRKLAPGAGVASNELDLAGLNASQREKAMQKFREISRQQYVSKRTEKQTELLEQELLDEIEFFEGEELSKQEKRKLEEKKELLKLIRKRKNNVVDESQLYIMPTANENNDGYVVYDKNIEAMKQKFVPEDRLKSEQDEWQDIQQGMTVSSFGAKDKKTLGAEYDLLQLDEVEFVEDMIQKGINIEDLLKEEQETPKVDASLTKMEQIQAIRRSLPVYKRREELLDAIEKHQILIVTAETGSGKTTQIPQFLHEAGYTKRGMVGCTQPRRVAAMSVATRVAEEMGVKRGYEVGYSIRFEDCTSDKTIIKYMTDGMLLREFLTDPALEAYSVMIIDEAHERTLHTDILLGLMKDICREREDLRLIISSATMDASKFSDYFDGAPIFAIEGRRFDVTTRFTKAPEADYVEAAIVTVLQIHCTQSLPGDILVFLTGQNDIEQVYEGLTTRTRALGSKIKELIILPIYSTLPQAEQEKIFQPTPPNARKVVLATNIAETSLTIDGIKYVVDTGFCKQNSYNPKTGMESLIVTAISQAAAEQRSGRAGRTGPGMAFRLYTKLSYEMDMAPFTIPEIQRTNLASVVLLLKSLGLNDILHFDYIDPPPAESLIRALEHLYALGALNAMGELTKLGRRMAEFPCDPQMAKAIIQSEKYGCSEEIITIISMLDSSNSIFYNPKNQKLASEVAHKRFSRGTFGDHIALLVIYNEWKETNYSQAWCQENFIQYKSMKRARDVREQLEGLCERVEVQLVSNERDYISIRKALCEGFFANVARVEKSGEYHTLKKNKVVSIHPGSSLFNQERPCDCVLFHELVYTTKDFLRICTEIEVSWIKEIAPHYFDVQALEVGKKQMPRAVGKSSMKQ